MIVKFLLIILILHPNFFLEPVPLTSIKDSRPSEYNYYQLLKLAFIKDFDFFDDKIRKCFAEVFQEHIETPESLLRTECVGRYNELVHFIYSKQMRRLKRAFFNLVVKDLEPFRVKYEDEIVYFLFSLNMITAKDLKLKESLGSVVKMTKFQVHPRRFFNLIEIDIKTIFTKQFIIGHFDCLF